MRFNRPELTLGIDAWNIRGGGANSHLRGLLSAAEPSCHGIDRVLLWGNCRLIQDIAPRPWLTTVHVPALDGALPVRLFWRAQQLPRLTRRHCDVVLIPGGGSGRHLGTHVTMCRNMLPFDAYENARYGVSYNRLRNTLLRRTLTSSYLDADGVIFLTDLAMQRVLSATQRIKGEARVIPHGIDERFRLPPRVQMPPTSFSRDKPFRFLYVSDVDVYKHHWNVIEAVATLASDGLPLHLHMVGGVRHRRSQVRLQRALQQFDPDERVTKYIGSVAYDVLPFYYNNAHAFIYASSCENMPNILLEAMASGLPIACSDSRPMPDLLRAGGAYFDPERPHSIATALKQLFLSASLRTSLAERAFAYAQHWTWERCAHDTFGFLAHIARQRPPCTFA